MNIFTRSCVLLFLILNSFALNANSSNDANSNNCRSNTCSSVQKLIGDAFDLKTGKLVYQEFHTVDRSDTNGSMRSEYKHPDSSLIATRNVNFKNGRVSDYRFEQKDLSIDKHLTRHSNHAMYYSQSGSKQNEKRIELNNADNTVIYAGIFNVIQQNWNALTRDTPINLSLLAPAKGKAFDMILQKKTLANSNAKKYLPSKNVVLFTLSIKNRLLSLLLKPVELAYDTSSKRLLYYQGPSNITADNGVPIKLVRIMYSNDP